MEVRWQKFLKWQHLGICVISLVTLIMHFSIIMIPDKVLFDEAFYVNDARSIIQGQGTQRGEHPPLGKFLVTTGLLIFGDNPLGWRFFSVIAGTIALIVFYLICLELSLTKVGALIATFLLAFENIFFVQSSVGMLDVFCVSFSMVTFYFYLRQKYLTTGLFAALSVMAKLNGALVIPVVFLHWIVTRRDKPLNFLLALCLSPLFFVALFSVFHYFIQGQWQNPFSLIKTMLSGTASLTFANVTHVARQAPWDWFIHRVRIDYWFTPNYFGMLSIDIFFVMIPTTVYMTLRSFWKVSNAARFGLAWFIGTCVLWIPIVLITDRVTYGYYIYPCVGALCIGLGLALSDCLNLAVGFEGNKWKWTVLGLVTACLLVHFGVFVATSPVFSRWF